MSTISKHTCFLLLNEKSKLEMVTYAPNQHTSGQRASDSYALAQGLFIDNVSHELWLDDVNCHRVIGTPSGLHTIKNLQCKIIAKMSFLWDMSKPFGERQSELKKSAGWDAVYEIYQKK